MEDLIYLLAIVRTLKRLWFSVALTLIKKKKRSAHLHLLKKRLEYNQTFFGGGANAPRSETNPICVNTWTFQYAQSVTELEYLLIPFGHWGQAQLNIEKVP